MQRRPIKLAIIHRNEASRAQRIARLITDFHRRSNVAYFRVADLWRAPTDYVTVSTDLYRLSDIKTARKFGASVIDIRWFPEGKKRDFLQMYDLIDAEYAIRNRLELVYQADTILACTPEFLPRDLPERWEAHPEDTIIC